MVTHHMLSCLDDLEAEGIYILREVAAQFERPAILYSVGKDSSVLLRLAQKAFYPGKIPFPLVHVDTGYKFAEMYTFRDQMAMDLGCRLIVHRNEEAIAQGANPFDLGTDKCCGKLKTKALLDVLNENSFDAAIGGARRDEEKSRAKERIFSFRDSFGQWDPRNQRPELWNQLNGRIRRGESIRVFPLSNWTELDIWLYIYKEQIPIVPLYFARSRSMVIRGGQLLPNHPAIKPKKDDRIEDVICRYRTLGCMPCTGAIRSEAKDLEAIIAEILAVKTSERANRVIDHDGDSAMEKKKQEGYF